MKDKISKLILFYPVFCIPDDARAGKMMFAKFDPNNIPDTIKCGPMKLGRCYVEDVININPYDEIGGFSGDVLIVHGTKDKIVNMKYIERAYQTYLKENADNSTQSKVVLKIIDGGKHMFSDLYQVPVKNQKGYFYIKILELLLFLSEENITENEFEKQCYTKAQADLAKRIREYMLAHMNVHITLKELEEHFHMSGSHLKKMFKCVYGVTIVDYTRTQKMESAAYMLDHTDKSILEIANAHGYYNASKFANAFRTVKGCNPNGYRKKFKKVFIWSFFRYVWSGKKLFFLLYLILSQGLVKTN